MQSDVWRRRRGGDTIAGTGLLVFRADAMTPVSMPAQLGRYKLLRPLGQGGMGAVWVALDTRLQREVALKMPLVNAETNPVAIERFQREARLAASIDHPNFCPVHDVGDEH